MNVYNLAAQKVETQTIGPGAPVPLSSLARRRRLVNIQKLMAVSGSDDQGIVHCCKKLGH